MTEEELENSARFYVNLYKNEHLLRATVWFFEERGHFIASYFFDRIPNDEDKEECELFCGEIVGSFPEIRTAETVCEIDGIQELPSGQESILVFSL